MPSDSGGVFTQSSGWYISAIQTEDGVGSKVDHSFMIKTRSFHATKFGRRTLNLPDFIESPFRLDS